MCGSKMQSSYVVDNDGVDDHHHADDDDDEEDARSGIDMEKNE